MKYACWFSFWKFPKFIPSSFLHRLKSYLVDPTTSLPAVLPDSRSSLREWHGTTLAGCGALPSLLPHWHLAAGCPNARKAAGGTYGFPTKPGAPGDPGAPGAPAPPGAPGAPRPGAKANRDATGEFRAGARHGSCSWRSGGGKTGVGFQDFLDECMVKSDSDTGNRSFAFTFEMTSPK